MAVVCGMPTIQYSAICAQAVYFLHSTRHIVAKLMVVGCLSDVEQCTVCFWMYICLYFA